MSNAAASKSGSRYLAGKFLKRNKLAVASAGIVLVSLITGLAFALWQANVARQERDRAEKRFQDVRQLSNSLLFEIAPKIERLQGSTEARELLVKRALTYLDSLAAESRSDAGLSSELADAYQKIGDLQGNPRKPNLSDFAGAIESYTKSIELIRQLPASPANDRREAESRRELASILFTQGETKRSIEESQASIAILERLIAGSPSDNQLLMSRVAAEIGLGYTYAKNNQYDVAIPTYNKVLSQLDALDGNDPEILRSRAICTSYLSNALSWDGKQDDAEAATTKAEALARELEAKFPADATMQKTVFEIYSLSSSNYETIKNDISLRYTELAYAVAKRSAELDPFDTQAKQNLAKAISRQGIILVLLKKTDEGIAKLRTAEASFKDLIAREPRNRIYQDDLGRLYTRLGDAQKFASDLPAALAEYKRSAELFKALADADEKNTVARRDWAQALKSVGVTERKLGQIEQALASLTLTMQIVDDLKQKNALGKWDIKIFDQVPPIIEELKGK